MADLPEKVFVEALQAGQQLHSTFALAAIQMKEYTGGHFLQIKLADRTGKIPAVMWKNAAKVYPRLTLGEIVLVRGKVDTYRERLQVNVYAIEPLQDEQSVEMEDYLRMSEVDPESFWEALVKLCQSVTDPYLRQLLDLFVADEAIKTGFLQAPGGKQWHHAYIGGLAEHTLGVAQNCEALAERYPALHRDLLLVGAIMHDLGKTQELTYGTVMDYSDVGRLVGHQVLSYQIAQQYMAQIEGFPSHYQLQIQHMILAHHGEAGDAIRAPMTLEALVLSRADDIDAQMNAYCRELTKAQKSGREWSDYVNLINRYLYSGPQPFVADDFESDETPESAPPTRTSKDVHTDTEQPSEPAELSEDVSSHKTQKTKELSLFPNGG